MPRLLYLSPMVPSTDVAATAQFLHDALGFEVKRIGTYAICERDGLTLHLQPAGETIMGTPTTDQFLKDLYMKGKIIMEDATAYGQGEQSIYLEVDDLNAL